MNQYELKIISPNDPPLVFTGKLSKVTYEAIEVFETNGYPEGCWGLLETIGEAAGKLLVDKEGEARFIDMDPQECYTVTLREVDV